MTDAPSIEYPDCPFRGKSLIDRKPLFKNALTIENEEIEKKFDSLEKMARRHNDLVYKEAERVSQENP